MNQIDWNGSKEHRPEYDPSILDMDERDDYIFDRADVRAVGIILYSIVFIACFFGNLIVIVVVTVHWRMRSITNFCLANLAFADFCVSIFCVYQNMYIYFMESWVFGAFLCKMYYFITELSHTASILILVVICIERYLAIVHPMRCKEWLTLTRLRVTIIGVWGTSAFYSSPRLYFTNIGTMPMREEEVLCIPIRTLYDSRTFDMISLAILFVIPLLVISILYTRIGLALWESSSNQVQQNYLHASAGATPSVPMPGPPMESFSTSSDHDCIVEAGDFRPLNGNGNGNCNFVTHGHSCANILCCCSCEPCRERLRGGRTNGSKSSRNLNESSRRTRSKLREEFESPLSPRIEPIVVVRFENGARINGRGNRCTISFNNECKSAKTPEPLENQIQMNGKAHVPKLRRMTVTRGTKYGSRALESRRRIIKMLIIIVVAFAVCNLPFHARKLWQSYGSGYSAGSTFSSLFTPITFLIMYANSGINPILYAFMSKKFRLCFMDLIQCRLRRSLRIPRNVSVRSTHIIPLSTPA